MNVEIRLEVGGSLAEHLPPECRTGLPAYEVAGGATPEDVLRALGLPLEDNLLVSLNGSVVPRSQRASHPLAAGDRLVVMPALRGG